MFKRPPTIEVKVNVRIDNLTINLVDQPQDSGPTPEDEALGEIQEEIQGMTQQLDQVLGTLGDVETVTESVVQTIDALIADLNSAKDNPAQVQAVADRLAAIKNKLANAVLEGTTAEQDEDPLPVDDSTGGDSSTGSTDVGGDSTGGGAGNDTVDTGNTDVGSGGDVGGDVVDDSGDTTNTDDTGASDAGSTDQPLGRGPKTRR